MSTIGTIYVSGVNDRSEKIIRLVAFRAGIPLHIFMDLLAETLIANDALTPEDMREHVRAHTFDVICPCFEWRDGDYRFQDGVQITP